MERAISLLSIQHFGKEHGSETHSATRWPAPTVAFTALHSYVANGTEIGANPFTKFGEGRTFTSTFFRNNLMGLMQIAANFKLA